MLKNRCVGSLDVIGMADFIEPIISLIWACCQALEVFVIINITHSVCHYLSGAF